ncbi:hypothetical protein [Hirschia litorea]|uniref:MarR family transcriptional regulator n=1 Tax=Hirschia litorea TaxID=1199156 RepID=A0ABW2IPK4_9PROT
MKSQDIAVLLKLISLQQRENKSENYASSDEDDPYSMRSLGASLGISKSEINNSINRSLNSGLARREWDSSHPIVNRKALFKFILNGLKYVFPVKPGALARGLPTGFAAPVLQEKILSAGEDIFIWPDANGSHKGQAIAPLYKNIPLAAQQDANLYDYLAIIDAIRLGNPREVKIASELLENKLFADD